MSGWLRSIQGQLTEFASDVLNEATEDVVDAESELQVARRKCAEAERTLVQEQQKVGALESKVKELETQTYETHVEMDAIAVKYGTMVSTRDEEIKRLRIELEQARSSGHDDAFSSGSSSEERIAELTREVAHWKTLLQQHQKESQSGISTQEVETKIEEERRRKEMEIAALVAQHEHNVQELRDHYEEMIAATQTHSSSDSNQSDLLDAVLLEKEELLEEKKRLEELVKQREEADRPVMLDMDDVQLNDLEERVRMAEADIIKMNEMANEIDMKNEEILKLKRQNDELNLAYIDLNKDLEAARESGGQHATNNHELMVRIDHLKANLIEYEERYEMCKRENADTVRQLERLNKDFDRLKSGFDESKQRAVSQDETLNTEVDRLRDALEQSKVDRDKLREDVDRFRGAVTQIDDELQGLRDSNRRLGDDNQHLSDTIDKYDDSVKELLTRNEEQMSIFRKDFEDLQTIHLEKDEKWEGMVAELKEKCAVLEEELTNARREMGTNGSRVEMVDEEGEGVSSDSVPQSCENRDRPTFAASSSLLKENSDLRKLVNAMKEQLSTYEQLNSAKSDLDTSIREKSEADSLRLRQAWQEIETLRSQLDERVPELVQETSSWDGVPAQTLNAQLREALVLNDEKTNECERLRAEKENLDKELQMRQGVVDEMIAQTNILQMQQQHSAATLKQLRQETAEKEKEHYDRERELIRARERVELLEVKLERAVNGEDEDGERVVKVESSTVGSSPVDSEVDTLKEKLDTVSKYAHSLEEENVGLGKEIEQLTEKLSQVIVQPAPSVSAEPESSGGDGKKEEREEEMQRLEKRLHDAETHLSALNGIKSQYDQKTMELEQKRAEIETLQAELSCARSELETERMTWQSMQHEVNQARHEDEEMHQAQIAEKQTKVETLENDLIAVTQERDHLSERVNTLERQVESVGQTQGSEAELHQRIAALEQTNQQLKEIATAKHTESVDYYQKLEASMQESARLVEQSRHAEERLAAVEGQLNSAAEQNEKRGRELARLKEHLMLVEEASTREAVEAEKRETELRSLIRSLEETSQSASHTVVESSQHYQNEIRLLRARLEASEAEALEWRDKYEQESTERVETQSALSSLQAVVRELAVDQEKDSAAASHKHFQLQQSLQEQSRQITELQGEIERIGLDRQAAEEQTESYRDQLSSKQRIVEELEVQLEEARAPTTKPQDHYRIDDVTLRQLFLSYFLAPVDKRGDIALLLSSILEYPEEDREKIKQAVRPNGSPQRARSLGPTLTEQFIRFLETESESSRTAPHLPVTRESSQMRPTDPLPQSGGVRNNNESTTALHNLLQ